MMICNEVWSVVSRVLVSEYMQCFINHFNVSIYVYRVWSLLQTHTYIHVGTYCTCSTQEMGSQSIHTICTSSTLYCTLYCIVLYCIVLYCIVLYCIVLSKLGIIRIGIRTQEFLNHIQLYIIQTTVLSIVLLYTRLSTV